MYFNFNFSQNKIEIIYWKYLFLFYFLMTRYLETDIEAFIQVYSWDSFF